LVHILVSFIRFFTIVQEDLENVYLFLKVEGIF